MKKILQWPSNDIERLLQHSRYLAYLTKRLLTFLPSEFTHNVFVLAYRVKKKQHCLIISSKSSAWASKLRFHIPALIRSLSAEPQFSQLEKILIRVNDSQKKIPARKNNPKYSIQSANTIKESAQEVSNDDLKKSLLRLAKHVRTQ